MVRRTKGQIWLLHRNTLTRRIALIGIAGFMYTVNQPLSTSLGPFKPSPSINCLWCVSGFLWSFSLSFGVNGPLHFRTSLFLCNSTFISQAPFTPGVKVVDGFLLSFKGSFVLKQKRHRFQMVFYRGSTLMFTLSSDEDHRRNSLSHYVNLDLCFTFAEALSVVWFLDNWQQCQFWIHTQAMNYYTADGTGS